MNDKKLECLVEGYEGTYYEIGQVWETRNGEKIVFKDFIKDADYPLLFDIGNTIYEEFTLRGTFYEGDEHDLDLVKLISTESTPSEEPQPKTLSEYLKENNAYESFVENYVEYFIENKEYFLENKECYKDSALNDIEVTIFNISITIFNISMNKNFKQNFNYRYWYNLYMNQPKNLIYDMKEIVFSEVDKRLSKEERSPKRYMLFVEGKSSPKKIHTDLDTAEEEAKRLATQEIGSKVFLVEIVKEYKSRLEIDEL